MKIQSGPFRKVIPATAAEICARVDLSREATAFLVPDLSPQGYLSLLVEGGHFADAVRFLAFSLPIREGVWWACVVANAAIASQASDGDRTCLESASAWVYDPVEERRRTCLVAAEAADLEGPAAYAALAAFWSGGSLAPEGMPDAPADARLGPIGVGASVLLSLTAGDPLQMHRRFEAVMARGVDIANGGNGRLDGDAAMLKGG